MVVGNCMANLRCLPCRPIGYIRYFQLSRSLSNQPLVKMNQNKDAPKHVKKRNEEWLGPAPFIDLQVIGTGAKGSPRSVMLNLVNSRWVNSIAKHYAEHPFSRNPSFYTRKFRCGTELPVLSAVQFQLAFSFSLFAPIIMLTPLLQLWVWVYWTLFTCTLEGAFNCHQQLPLKYWHWQLCQM